MPIEAGVQPDDWEHSNWFFLATWGHQTFRFDIQCMAFDTETANRWLISVTRARIPFLDLVWSLFRPSLRSREPPPELQALFFEALVEIASPTELKWLANDDVRQLR